MILEDRYETIKNHRFEKKNIGNLDKALKLMYTPPIINDQASMKGIEAFYKNRDKHLTLNDIINNSNSFSANNFQDSSFTEISHMAYP